MVGSLNQFSKKENEGFLRQTLQNGQLLQNLGYGLMCISNFQRYFRYDLMAKLAFKIIQYFLHYNCAEFEQQMLRLKLKIEKSQLHELNPSQMPSYYIIFKFKQENKEIVHSVTTPIQLFQDHQFTFDRKQINKIQIWDYENLAVIFKGSFSNVTQSFCQKYKLKHFKLVLGLKVKVLQETQGEEAQQSGKRLSTKKSIQTDGSQNLVSDFMSQLNKQMFESNQTFSVKQLK